MSIQLRIGNQIYIFLFKNLRFFFNQAYIFSLMEPHSFRPVRIHFILVLKRLIMSEPWQSWLLVHIHILVDPKSEYKEANRIALVMYSENIFSVAVLNTLSVHVRVVSLSRLRPAWVASLSSLCSCLDFVCPGASCPGYVLSGLCHVLVTFLSGLCLSSVQVVSVRVASCPGCVYPGCVLAPKIWGMKKVEALVNSKYKK